MDRSWLSHSYERGSVWRHDAAPYARERGSFPRDKTWFAVIECGFIAAFVFIAIISVLR